MNGDEYSMCRFVNGVKSEQGCEDARDFTLIVNDKKYDWDRFNAMGNVEDGYVSESYADGDRRVTTYYDISGNGMQLRSADVSYKFDAEGNRHIYDSDGNEIMDEVDLEVEKRFIIKNGESKDIKTVEDLIHFLKSLDNGSLAMLVAQNHVASFFDKLPKSELNSALISLIGAFPADDPKYIMMLWNQLLKAQLLNERCRFLSPDEILGIRQSQSNRVGTVEDFSVFNALWSRLNGYQTTVYDVRYISAEGGGASSYPVIATDSKTGDAFMLDKGYLQKIDSGVTMESVIAQYNEQLRASGSEDRLEIKDKTSF